MLPVNFSASGSLQSSLDVHVKVHRPLRAPVHVYVRAWIIQPWHEILTQASALICISGSGAGAEKSQENLRRPLERITWRADAIAAHVLLRHLWCRRSDPSAGELKGPALYMSASDLWPHARHESDPREINEISNFAGLWWGKNQEVHHWITWKKFKKRKVPLTSGVMWLTTFKLNEML